MSEPPSFHCAHAAKLSRERVPYSLALALAPLPPPRMLAWLRRPASDSLLVLGWAAPPPRLRRHDPELA
jgi:hypothetical protein